MKNTRVAVIGVGVMGNYHCRVYSALPQAELVAIADPCLDRITELQLTYDVEIYQNHLDLLENEDIDAVSLAAPTSKHFEIAKDILNAGKHLLIEKPITVSLEEAKELVELSKEKHLVLQVGHITRFFKAVKLLKEKVKAPFLIEAKRKNNSSRIVDVGVILDLMIHDIDIVLGLIDSKTKSLAVNGKSLNGNGFEDVATADVVFENGCIAHFLASRSKTDTERNMVITEKEQTLRLDFAKPEYNELKIERLKNDSFDVAHTQVDIFKVIEDNPLREEIVHFLDRFRNNAEPIGTLDDDLRSLELANQLISMLKLDNEEVA